MKRDSNEDRPLWLSAVYSCAISGLPLLLVREHTWFALCAWLFVGVAYLGMVRLFEQTRIEAGVISFMLACTLAAAIHAVHLFQEVQAERQALEESREQRGGTSQRLE